MHFARLLSLPANPIYCEPMIVQLPTRYRPLFTEGCEAAFSTAAVAKVNGAVVHNSSAELYRAAFMPLRLKVDALKPIVYGSFNYRALDRIPDKWRPPST